MALWFFQRTAPGNLCRIPLPYMQRFLAGERALAHDGDGYVRCIGMAVAAACSLHGRDLECDLEIHRRLRLL